MKIITVIGARPQFIKAAVVSQAIAQHTGMMEKIIHTGQHFDANMSDVFFDELGIPSPAQTLGIHSLGHGAMTGRMLEAIEHILQVERPDWMLVYGDTNSTLAGALAAVKLHVPVAHVEAGLRSFNRKIPEEINRISTDHMADLLFAPTQAACDNLNKEGISIDRVIRTGDVMYDCALRFGEKARQESDVLASVGVREKQFALCTAHRAENTDSPELLATLFDALGQITQTIPVVLPIHPRTRTLATAHGIDLTQISGLFAIEPVSYLDMVRLEQAAALILTDSGGVQKEAYFHGVPCVTLRPQTEWVELVESGWNHLCPLESGADAIVSAVKRYLGSTGELTQLYGDGNASQVIVDALRSGRYANRAGRNGGDPPAEPVWATWPTARF